MAKSKCLSTRVVQVVSGGWPYATWLASAYARSFPIEWLCALILPICVRTPDLHRVLRVCVIDSSVSRWMRCR
jgi:hypothetical protein